jgi:hypothetical protein
LELRFKSYEVLIFHVKFGHAVSHCQCSKICPKLPKIAQNYQNLPKDN